MQAATGLEHIGLPPVVAGLAVLVFALAVLDTFNQSVLGAGTFHNPVNSLGFAAAGKGPFASHVLRMVTCSCLPRQFTCAHLCNAPLLLKLCALLASQKLYACRQPDVCH